MSDFQKALRRLVTEANYRNAVTADPARLTKDYKLGPSEVLLLMQTWVASGDPHATRSIDLCHCCCGASTST